MKLLVCLIGLSVGKNINVNDIKRKLVLPCVKVEGPLVDGRLIADGRKETWKVTLVVYIVSHKVPMKVRRWSLMVNFTGSGQCSLCRLWYWREPIRLTMSLHLRIFMGTSRHTICTTHI